MLLGRHDEALAQLEKATTLEPNGIEAYLLRADVLFEGKNDLEGAKAALDQVLAIKEYLPDAHRKFGEVLFREKLFEDGCQRFAQALVQMKLLRAPTEKIAAIRDSVRERLVKDAKRPDIAKLWLEETERLVQ